VATLTEAEFARICEEIRADSERIVEHNPIGTHEETLLWMLLSVLVSYLSLAEAETPCFTGRPDAQTYRDAIEFVLKGRRSADFETATIIANMLSK
jgi:hypothetical protein